MAKTKKEKIREFKRENPGATSEEVAAELETNASYVRRVWNASDTDPEPSPEEGGGDGLGGLSGGGGDLSGGEGEKLVESGSDNPLHDLVIADEHESYVCDECGSEVEYLDTECPNGHGLMWIEE